MLWDSAGINLKGIARTTWKLKLGSYFFGD